ncbi:MAG: hypothetical protein LC118_17455, partial [Dehalococcoidia bacterium]|nr:hypothetical protein [Dehalococcoidia bacterium]
ALMAAGLVWFSYAELKILEESLIQMTEEPVEGFESKQLVVLPQDVYDATVALLDKVRRAIAVHERAR